VWHGTTGEKREQIEKEGFKVFVGMTGSAELSHGYEGGSSYHEDIPAPVHHLGYGIYFTTVRAIAKQFSGGTMRGMKEYYLDVPRLETINFGAPRTMMKWWISNGYNYKEELAKSLDEDAARLAATENMTENLKSKYDAVWFKGKGLRRLLDGDQIVVFDTDKIYQADSSLAKPFDIGSKVRRKIDGMKGIIKDKRKTDFVDGVTVLKERLQDPEYADIKEKLENQLKRFEEEVKLGNDSWIEVKWDRGGTDFNVLMSEIDPV
jgi:hypothetical protein